MHIWHPLSPVLPWSFPEAPAISTWHPDLQVCTHISVLTWLCPWVQSRLPPPPPSTYSSFLVLLPSQGWELLGPRTSLSFFRHLAWNLAWCGADRSHYQRKSGFKALSNYAVWSQPCPLISDCPAGCKSCTPWSGHAYDLLIKPDIIILLLPHRCLLFC